MTARVPAAAALTLAALVLGAGGCDPGAPRSRIDPGLEARIAQARVEASTSPEARLRLGELELEAGLLFDAAETFLAAKSQGVNDVRVASGLARTYVRLGYVAATVGALRECFRVSPGEPDCLYAFATLIERDPSERAQREAQRTWARFLLVAPADHPKRGYAESALAQLTGRFGPLSQDDIVGPGPGGAAPAAGGEARGEGDAPGDGAGPAPGGPAVPGHEGSTGDAEVAGLNPFGKALQKAYRALAEEDPKGAIAGFEEALALKPDDPTTLAGLAEAQLAARDMEAAVASAEKAWRLDPEDPQVRYAFGLVMLRNQQRGEEALGAWRALLRDTPELAQRLGVEALLERASGGGAGDGDGSREAQ